MSKSILLLMCAAQTFLWAGNGVSTQKGEILPSSRSSANPTQLLFPYATVGSGFDTEISISNTSLDTLGSASQAGSCSLNFYSAGSPPSPGTTISIAAG